MRRDFYKRIIFFSLFTFLMFALSLLPAQADEGKPVDWEKRFKALEARVETLEKENADLRNQLGTATTEQQVKEVSPVGLEERIAKIEKNLTSRLEVGHGTMKIGGLLQGWYVVDQDANDRFRLRRSELKLSGKISEEQPIEYTVMVDPAQVTEDASRKSILQDAFFTLGYIPHHTIDIGQYKTGIGEEGTRSSAKLDTIERAFISRTFSDQRDIGIRLSGKWPWVDYNVGVFNGSGQNQSDPNDQKDIAGRMVFRPLNNVEAFKGLEIGVSGYHRPAHGDTFAKKRLGFEARYEYKKFSLKGEYIKGQGTASSSATAENRTLAQGWYGQIGYFFLPKLQGVLKYEQYDPNEEISDDRVREAAVGLNYFLDKYHAKLQINYIHKDEEAENELANDQIIGALQVAF